MTLYLLRDAYDTQSVYCCQAHARLMPAVDGELVTAYPCDDDITCDFCDSDDEGKHYSIVAR